MRSNPALVLRVCFASLVCSAAPGALPLAHATEAGLADPRETPVPPIITGLPALPGPGELPEQIDLPDPLVFDDGHRVTSIDEWPARREEIKKKLLYYATGSMPPAPGNVRGRELAAATVLDALVHYRLVHLSFGPDEKLGFDIAVFTPASPTGPRPTIIFPTFDPTPGSEKLPLLPRPPGQGKGVNALLPASAYTPPAEKKSPAPATATTASNGAPRPDKTLPSVVAASHRALFERGYALVLYHYQDTGEDTTLRFADGSWAFRSTRQFSAYPKHDWGLAAGWAWGISRVIDFLETQDFADKNRFIATGHSRVGKAVFIAGAFDERIALSAPAGSGAGGTAAYRFTGAGRGGKEGLDDMMRKYPNWFSPNLHPFRGQTDKLPFDQHWFLALTAPRAFISLEGIDDQNCVPNAVRQTIAGAAPVYSLFNDTSRAVAHYAPHRHRYDAEDWAALLDFADHILLGKPAARTFNNFPPDPAPGSPETPAAR